MNSQPSYTLEVAPGQHVAVDESGDPNGRPLFFFHGWPASRLQGAGFSVEARELGVRIIAPDRPGIGLSERQPGRRLLDWPPVVKEIARQLGISRFMVMAVSGGGPYAFATAFALPEMVEAVSVISGAPPLAREEDREGLLPMYRLLLQLHGRVPRLLAAGMHAAQPFLYWKPPRWLHPLILKLAPAGEQDALREQGVLEGSLDNHREAWRGSARGVLDDGEIYMRDWDFPLEEIRAPIRIWHGRDDTSFPWQLAEKLARRLPNCALRIEPGEGHYSLPFVHRRKILLDLLAAAVPA